MAFDAGAIVAHIRADLSNFESGMRRVEQRSAEVSRQASQSFGNIANGIENVAKKAVLLASAGSFGIGQFVLLARDLETAQARMAALAGSTDQARKILGELYNFTLGKPIAFPDAAKAAQTLMGYGVATDQVVDAMKTLSAFSIVNGADMGMLALAYGQVNAKGRLMGQEIIQLTNNFVPVSQVIAKHFNVSLQEAQALMEDGKVSAADFNAAMANFLPADAIERQSNTFKNRLISLQGQIRAFGLALIGVKVDPALGLVVEPGGLFDRLSNFIPKITASLKEMKPRVQEAMDFILRNGDTIKAIIVGLATAYTAAKVAAIGFAIAATANPVTLIAAAITALIGVLGFLQARFGILNPLINAMKAAWDFLRPSIMALWNTISQSLLPALQHLWEVLSPILMPVLKLVAAVIGGIVVGQIWVAINVIRVIAQAVSTLIGWFANLIGWGRNLAGALGSAFASARDAASTAFSSIWGWVQSIQNKFSEIVPAIKRALSGVWDAVTGPFRDAFNYVEDRANGVKNKLKNLNPFQRQSPSLYDLVSKGTEAIRHEYANMFGSIGDMAQKFSAVNLSPALVQGSGPVDNRTNTQIYGNINIGSEVDANNFLKRMTRNDELTSMGLSEA